MRNSERRVRTGLVMYWVAFAVLSILLGSVFSLVFHDLTHLK